MSCMDRILFSSVSVYLNSHEKVQLPGEGTVGEAAFLPLPVTLGVSGQRCGAGLRVTYLPSEYVIEGAQDMV